jgi:hypothetical protein
MSHFIPDLTVPFTLDDLIEYDCEIRSYTTAKMSEYESLCDLISDLVAADCWAVTINDEILFNSYNRDMPIKKHIKEELIRDKIIKNPHTAILMHINRKQTNFIIKIYMFGQSCWCSSIVYSDGIYSVKFYK